eukprot:jgi/Psemu1/290430/fgenesh1_pg.497_\
MSSPSQSPLEQQKPHCISFDDVRAASDRIRGAAHKTPVMTCRSLIASSEHDDGKEYFFKVEAMQKTGSFKFRGALNAVRSGNHAQAVALAARSASSSNSSGVNVNVKVDATIVMPDTAPLVKRNAVADFGATIVTVENTNEARKAAAERIVAEKNSDAAANENGTGTAVFVHPSEDPLVIAGQGTVCLEFVEQVRELAAANGADPDLDLDAVIIPVGGGGLAAGNCVALRALLGPGVKIVLAEPETLNDAKRSFDSGRLLGHPPGTKLDSVADGLKTTLGPNTWPIVRDCVDAILTVSEEEILRATKLVWERLKVAIEPSAGVGVAVARSREFHAMYPRKKQNQHDDDDNGIRNVGIILCGGNVDIGKIAQAMNKLGL